MFRDHNYEESDLYLWDMEDLAYEEDYKKLKGYYNSTAKKDSFNFDSGDDSYLDSYGECYE